MGVYLPVVGSMWGVLIFIRFSVIVAYTGWVMAAGMVLVSAFAQVLTTLSLCAVMSNSSSFSGGAFGVLRRNIGSEMAGVVSIAYYLGMACLGSIELLGAVQAIDTMLASSAHYQGSSVTSSRYLDQLAIGAPLLLLLASLRGLNVRAVHALTFGIFLYVVLFLLLGFTGVLLTLGTWTGAVGDLAGFTGLDHEVFDDNRWANFTLPSYDADYETLGVTEEMVKENAVGSPQAALSLIFPMFLGVLQGANKASELRTPGT